MTTKLTRQGVRDLGRSPKVKRDPVAGIDFCPPHTPGKSPKNRSSL